jgi:hypothetical protein
VRALVLLLACLLVAAPVEAAPGSVTFPQGTYGPGTLAPFEQNVQGTLSTATFTYDIRQHTNPAVLVSIVVEWSDDGGSTWHPLGAFSRRGGPAGTTPGGVAATTSVLTITVPPAQPRRVRATITITGGSVVTSGSLVWT